MAPWYSDHGIPTYWIGSLPQGVEEIPAPVVGEYEAKVAAEAEAKAKKEADDLAKSAAMKITKAIRLDEPELPPEEKKPKAKAAK